VRVPLLDPNVNIDVAARLLKGYLEKLCSASSAGTITASFQSDLASGCDIRAFCCGRGSCDSVVTYNAPRCLIQVLSGIWNNGPLSTGVRDIPSESPNGYNHGLWAGYLDGIFDP
jgi:hypothetical protein